MEVPYSKSNKRRRVKLFFRLEYMGLEGRFGIVSEGIPELSLSELGGKTGKF